MGECCCACLVTRTPYLHVHVVHQAKVERKDNQSSTKFKKVSKWQHCSKQSSDGNVRDAREEAK
jgi:hypothetical protein